MWLTQEILWEFFFVKLIRNNLDKIKSFFKKKRVFLFIGIGICSSIFIIFSVIAVDILSSPAIPKARTTIFCDSLNDNQKKWDLVEDRFTNSEIKDGKLFFMVKNEDFESQVLNLIPDNPDYYKALNLKNFRYEMRLIMVKSQTQYPFIGVIWGSDRPVLNFNRISFRDEEFRIHTYRNQEGDIPYCDWKLEPILDLNQFIDFRMDCIGEECIYYLYDQEIFKGERLDLSGNYFGIYSSGRTITGIDMLKLELL